MMKKKYKHFVKKQKKKIDLVFHASFKSKRQFWCRYFAKKEKTQFLFQDCIFSTLNTWSYNDIEHSKQTSHCTFRMRFAENWLFEEPFLYDLFFLLKASEFIK